MVLKLDRERERKKPRAPFSPIADVGEDGEELAPMFSLEDAKKQEYLQREHALRGAGYKRQITGLYKVGMRSNGTLYETRIFRGFVDVEERCLIYRVPIMLTGDAQPRDTILSVVLRSLDGQDEQHLPMSRRDMESRERAYKPQITVCSVPHARYTADFHDAINALSEAAPLKRRYDSSGVILTRDGPRFLNPIGPAISPTGPDEAYQVGYFPGIEETLRGVPYGWERGSAKDEAVADFQTALKMIGLSPENPAYGFTLLGIAAFAPLSQHSKSGGAHALVVHTTGGKKSASARIAQEWYASVWGKDDERTALNLRDARTKAYLIEQVLHYHAGMVVIPDDALKHSDTSEHAIRYFYGVVSLIGRTASTKTGAGRGKWGEGDGGAARGFIPRCSCIMTAEVLPEPEKHPSDLAAFAVLSLVGQEPIDLSLLSLLQDEPAAQALNRNAYSFIQWLLPRMEHYAQSIAGRERVYHTANMHARSPKTYAKIETGIAAFLDYGVSIGALTAKEAETILNAGRQALYLAFVSQQSLMGYTGSSHKAIDALPAFFASLERLHREHHLYSTASALREVACTDDSSPKKTGRPKPPEYLADDGIAITERGWLWDEREGVYREGSGAIESGVEEQEPGGRVTLKVYATRFKDVVYDMIVRDAAKHGATLPGPTEMMASLKKAGLLSTVPGTNLHGRGSDKKDCYLIKLPDEVQEATDTPPDDLPPCFRCGRRTENMCYTPEQAVLCADCYTLPPGPGDGPGDGEKEQGATNDTSAPLAPIGQETGSYLQSASNQGYPPAPAPDRPIVSPVSRQKVTAYVDVGTGRGILHNGRKLVGTPGADLARIVRALPPEVTRLFLTGPRPGGTLEAMRQWADAGETTLVGEWVQAGQYIPADEAETVDQDKTVLHFQHQETGRKLEIRRMAAWMGEHYTPEASRAMMLALEPFLQEAFGPEAYLLGTPAQTGKDLWKLSISGRWAEHPRLPDDVQALIRSTSGQGRIEHCPPKAATLPGLYCLDGIFMYAGLTDHIGSGPVQAHDTLNEYAEYTPARYRIRFTVPEGWQHLGLFGVKAPGMKWEYPSVPGYTGETWVDGAEYQMALFAQERTGTDWHIQILERLLLTPAKGHGPLYGWAKKLIGLRESLPGLVASGQIDTSMEAMLKTVLRNLVLHTIGSFNTGAHTITKRAHNPEQVPADNPTVLKRGDCFVWQETEKLAGNQVFFLHPEWSAAIWARCRSRLLLHRQKRGEEYEWSGALTLPRNSLVALRTDAIYSTIAPVWADGTRPGQFRVKGHIDEKIRTPRNDAALTPLRERMGE